ncbi:MAG: AI-2E family transporter [Candidatus Melainabacteria bacterium]|nr:AI-2E family transporter [Candidatus Melainabacteria bacterium]
MRKEESDSDSKSVNIHSQSSDYYKGPLVLIGAVILIWILIQIKIILIALVFAITLASSIAPVAEHLELNKKIPRAATVAMIFVIVGVIYAVLVLALFPTLKEQAQSLYSSFPSYAERIAAMYSKLSISLGDNVGTFAVSTAEIKNILSKASGHAIHFTSDLVTVFATAILVMFLTAFFVVEAKDIWPKLLEWLPRAKRERAATLIRPLESRLGGYIRGQLLVCLAVSTFLTIGLSLLKVEHALLLGALSGLLNLVPFVGSMITAVLSLVVAFNQSPELAGAVFLLFAAEQWAESNVIVPNLLGKQVELHPLIVLFSILIGASLIGVAGALIAVPLATAGVLLATEFYLKPLREKERLSAQNADRFDNSDAFAHAATILSESRSEPDKTLTVESGKSSSTIENKNREDIESKEALKQPDPKEPPDIR